MSKNHKGNAVLMAVIFVMIVLVIFVFIAVIFVCEMNSIIYNIKLDMYSINKTAIVSVDKGITSRGTFSYDLNSYKKQFSDLIKKNYKLDDNMKNFDGLVEEVQLLQYEIIKSNKKDPYTKKKLEDMTIHSVIKVKIKPIFLEELLSDVCTFEIHEDVVLNQLVT